MTLSLLSMAFLLCAIARPGRRDRGGEKEERRRKRSSRRQSTSRVGFELSFWDLCVCVCVCVCVHVRVCVRVYVPK